MTDTLETTPPAAPNPQPAPRRNRASIITAVIIAVGLVAAAALWANNLGIIDLSGRPPAKPIPIGSAIIVPDNQDAGLQQPPAGEDGDFADGLEPAYEDPDDMGQYRNVDAQGRVTYTIPIDGECPIEPNGMIGAPNNYRHACYPNTKA